MKSWLYLGPSGNRVLTDTPVWLNDAQYVGPRELKLLLQARKSRHRQVVLSHERAGNADRLAARRLVLRGLLSEPNYVGGAPSSWKAGRHQPIHLYLYALTDLGRDCWLRVEAGGK